MGSLIAGAARRSDADADADAGGIQLGGRLERRRRRRRWFFPSFALDSANALGMTLG